MTNKDIPIIVIYDKQLKLIHQFVFFDALHFWCGISTQINEQKTNTKYKTCTLYLIRYIFYSQRGIEKLYLIYFCYIVYLFWCGQKKEEIVLKMISYISVQLYIQLYVYVFLVHQTWFIICCIVLYTYADRILYCIYHININQFFCLVKKKLCKNTKNT